MIPTLRTRKQQREIDRERYQDRNLAERFWNQVKQFRRVATRYEKRPATSWRLSKSPPS